MKHFNEPFWNGNLDLPDCGAVPQLRYILVNFKIGEKIYCVFFNRNMHHRVHNSRQ